MPEGPLSGITVIDLTRVLAGPYCTMLLADLGARVIKIERPGSGDDARAFGPFVGGVSAYFASLNRGKQSIALDLDDERDRRRFESLLARADVLAENFRPGAMEKLGYGWETLHDRHPGLIYAAISGFGQTGPYRRRPAYDLVAQAMGGIMSLTGQEGSAPTRVGTSIGDISAALFAAIGIASALTHRSATGEGTLVDVAMMDSQIAILENAIVRHTASGEIPGPIGNRHPSITPFDVFTAADGPLVIAAGNDPLFGRLCRNLALPELMEDPRFRDNQHRTENQALLKELIEKRLSSRPAAEWLELLQQEGIPCGPINNIGELREDPQVAARNMLARLAEAEFDGLRIAGNPIKFSAFADSPLRGRIPALDEDREAVLDLMNSPEGEEEN